MVGVAEEEDAGLDAVAMTVEEVTAKEVAVDRPAATDWVELEARKNCTIGSGTKYIANQPILTYTSVCSPKILHHLQRCHAMNGIWVVGVAAMAMGMALVAEGVVKVEVAVEVVD